MKKQFYGMLIFASIFMMQPVFGAHPRVDETTITPLIDNSGQERIAHIMSSIKHDVVPGKSEPISYVQVSNIDKDLNVQEITNFFAPKTVMGHSFLLKSLEQPISPIDQSGIVELRKNAVTELVDNPQLKKQVEAILEDVAQQEQVVIELMSNTFMNKTCPEIEGLKKMKEEKWMTYPLINFMVTNRAYKTYDMVASTVMIPMWWLSAGMLGYAGYNEDFHDILVESSGVNISTAQCVGNSAYAALLASLMTYGFYDQLVKAGEKRARMHALNRLIHAAESIEQLSHDYNITSQFKMSLVTDVHGVAVVDALKASRYDNEIDYCFDVPAVNSFLYKLYENNMQLGQIFASLAEMDVYNAIATKILEAQTTDRKFCFAQTIASNKPQVSSIGFWNVLVPHAVINSMDLSKHVILTGPNAGGKTTSIRANLQNIVLAQTYGIAAAQEFVYTPFDVILSYLNISDDLINGYSLFASEIKRAKDLLEIIRALTPGQKLFFALDELFTGTAAEQGETCAYEFIKKTSGFDQILFVYATHFNKLKELGNQNIGLTNYKVDAPIKNDTGKLVYPFTLSLGASNVNIALDMAREANLFD